MEDAAAIEQPINLPADDAEQTAEAAAPEPEQAEELKASEAVEADDQPKQAIPSAKTEARPVDPNYTETDVFLWANNLVPIKEELEIELFLFNKNMVVYRPRVSKELAKQLQPLLIDGLLDAVLEGAGQGMVVRNFEDGEAEDKVLQRTQLSEVGKAREVLNWLQTQENMIEPFVEEEHDIKRLKGIIARVKHKELPWPFYIIKSVPAGMVMKGASAWLLRGGSFVPFDAEGSLRIPPDNQLLVLDQDIYVFNPAKLESLFGYNAKKYGIAVKKMEEIAEHFTFSFADELTMEAIVQGKKALVNKLQKIDPTIVTQDELLNHAEEVGVELMTDDKGAIIIMDAKDFGNFINLLNDDYIESGMTGQRYEIKSKKPLKIKEEAYGEEVV